jgi:EmrB/QacA subfamily drug resistance transporter
MKEKHLEKELSRGRRGLILANACVITFMATLDGSIVNIALPTIAKSFAVGISAVQWVVSSYLIAVSALLLVWGRLSDIHGRKGFFMAGLGVFTLGSLLCGLSGNLAALVASRVLQAVGASMAMALVQGIVTSAFPPQERGKALGFIGAVVSIGSLVGPSLGGVLVEAAGWRSIFFINVPIGLIGIVLTIFVMPDSKAPPRPDGSVPSFDAAGAVLLGSAITLFFAGMLALQEGAVAPAAPIAAIAASAVLLFAFLRVERGRADPLIEASLFRSRVFSMGVTDSCLSYIAMFSYNFFMPFYLQAARGMGVLEAGALMSIYPASTAVLAPLAGALSDRITYRPLTIAGLSCTAAGLVLLAALGPSASLVAVGAVIFLLGMGGAMFQSPNNSSVMGSAPRDRLGIAGSINSFFRNLGMVTGTTLAVSLFSFATKAGMDEVASGSVAPALFLKGFRLVVLAAAAFALAGAVGEVFGKKGAGPRR